MRTWCRILKSAADDGIRSEILIVVCLVRGGTAHKGGGRRPYFPQGRREALFLLIREAGGAIFAYDKGGVLLVQKKKSKRVFSIHFILEQKHSTIENIQT